MKISILSSRIPFLFLFLFFNSTLLAQVVIYSEDFNSYPDGTTSGPSWDATLFNNCDGENNNGTDFSWGVFGGEFVVSDAEGFNCCDCFGGPGGGLCGDNGNTIVFGPINIAGYNGISIDFAFDTTATNKECWYFDFAPPGTQCPQDDATPECLGGHDQAIFSYSVDGAPPVVFGFYCGNTFCYGEDFFCGGVTGNSLEIIITAGTQNDDEEYRIDNIEVTGFINPIAVAEANNTTGTLNVCDGDVVQLSETGGQANTWMWQGPGFSSSQQNPSLGTVNVGDSGDYIVEVEAPNGCVDSDTVTLVVNPIPDPSWTPSTACASGGPITLTPDGTPGGTWSGIGVTDNGDGTGTFDPTVNGAGIVTYTVTQNGCTDSETNTITIATITTSVTNITCDDNNTPTDPTDDTFTFTLTANGTNTGPFWTATDPDNTTGIFSLAETFGPFDISGGTLIFTLSDDQTGCSVQVSVTPPSPCSDECDLTAAGLSNVSCNNNGTPSNPADDYITFDLDPTGINLSGFYNISVSSGTVMPGGGGFGFPTTFQLQPGSAGGGNVTITIEDALDPNCSITVTLINPGSCSNACNLTGGGLTNVLCNDNGTNSDESDDYISFDLNPTGMNLGSSYSVSVSSGTINPTSGNYGSATSFTLQAGSAGAGNVVVTITDDADPSCTTTVTINDPGSCSPQCNLSDAGLGGVSCNDGGTPSNPVDDFVSFDLNPTGNNLGTTFTVTVSAGTVMPSTANYGTTTNFELQPGSAGGGDVTITITDDADPSCSIMIVVTDPGSCSNECEILNGGVNNIVCNDNGTPSDSTDDILQFDLNPSGLNLGTTYNVSVNTGTITPGSGTYGAVTTFQLQPGSAGGGNINVTITDGSDAGCVLTIVIADIGTCSPECNLSGDGLANILCNDNGTGTNPNDDIISFDLNPTGMNIGSSYSVSVSLGTITPTTASYGSPTNFQLQAGSAGAGDITVTITDDSDPGCSLTVNITDPGSCSDDCLITGVTFSIIDCNDNGTAGDPTDDFLEVAFVVNGTNTGGSFNLTVDQGSISPTSGTYGVSSMYQLQPGSAGGGAVNMTITDVSDPNCTLTVIILDPGSCSNTCSIDNPGLANTICNDGGTPSDPADDFISFDLNPSGVNLGTTYSVSVSSGTILPASASYGSTTNFQLNGGSAGSGNVIITITDDSDPSCSTTVTITDPGTCSSECSINGVTFNFINCNDGGTPSDPADDFIEFEIVVTGLNTGASFTPSVSSGTISPGSGNYNTPTIFTLQPGSAGGGTVTLTITDNADPNCIFSIPVADPGSCSNACSLSSAGLSGVNCNDNGTPSDPADDFISFDLNPGGMNLGTSYTVTASPGTVTPGSAFYGTTTSFQLQPGSAGAGNVTITITDDADPNCTTTVVISDPGTCSSECNLQNANLTNVQCDDFGTPTIPGDDLIVFDLDPAGMNLGTQYSVTSPTVSITPGIGTYGAPTTFNTTFGGAGMGDITITITDLNDPNCSITIVVPDPGTCSNSCTLTNGGLGNTICNDGGTPSDPADDFISFDLNPSGSNTGATYSVTVSSGTITPASGTYGTTTNFQLQPGSAGAGNVTVTISDDADPGCFITVNIIDPGPCSNACIISATNTTPVCNNNGTPSDPSDDTFTFLVTVTGSNTGGGWSANDPGGTTGSYDVPTPFGPYNISGGAINFTITDNADPNCTTQISVTPPATCSDQCEIEVIVSNILCNDNNTPSDPNDDIFIFDVLLTGLNTGAVWSANDPLNTSGGYGVPTTMGPYLISNGNLIITFTDSNDPNCTVTETAIAPNTCSGQCNIGNSVANIICNDFGTPSDPSDDTYTFEVTVNGSNTSGGWSATDPFGTTGGYGTPVLFGPYLISDGDQIFTIIDNGDPNCTTVVNVTAPATCSDECTINAVANVPICNDNGTPNDPSDDTFTFVVTVTGDNTGNSWFASDPLGTSGLYGVPVLFGPYPISGGNLNFMISDGNDPNCEVNITVIPPPVCSSSCPDPDTTFLSAGTCDSLIAGTTDTLVVTDMNGCDSLVLTTFNLLPLGINNLDITICPNDTAFINGEIYTMAGIFTDTITGGAANGCDSILIINSTVPPTDTNFINQTLCTGDTLFVNGMAYTEANASGMEIIPDATAEGCDSIISIDLSFGSASVENIAQTLCPGESITVNNIVYDEANPMGSDTIPNGSSGGCDSIINVNLTFLTNPGFDLIQTLCTGESITVNGVVYDENNPTGTEVLVDQASNGCDSIVNIDLSFGSASVENIAQTLCPGESITVNNIVYDEANPMGSDTIPNGSSGGCDSIINVNLTFLTNPDFDLIQTLCTGESITVNGVVYDENNPTGTEVLVDQASNGCDSIVNIDLSFGSASVENIAQTLCPGESITVNNIVYDEANPMGSDTIPNGSSGGCDSIINVNLTFLTNPGFDLIQTLCTGESITVNGVVYDENNPTGTEVLVDQASNGCDSIVNIDLSFGSASVENIAQTLCPGESITVNNIVYDEANPMGSDTIPNGSSGGCDSIINVNLTFLTNPGFDLIQTLCTGESITVNGVVYDENNPTGTEVLVDQASNGCDSIVNIDLSFGSASVENIAQTLCPGESITVNNIVYDEANPMGSDTIPNGSSGGCDSIINVNLTFLTNPDFDLIQTLCTGESITVNGVVYDENNPTGTEVLVDQASNGCDSIVNIDLSFGSASVENIAQTLCPGESITVNNIVYDENNSMGSDTIPNGSSGGCDSIINVNLTFLTNPDFDLTQTLCTGESITVNGVVYDENNPTGTEVLVDQASNGCDSIVNIDLSFGSASVENIAQTLCPGESITVNNIVYDEANPMGSDTIPNGSSGGCDSIINVNLTFLTNPGFDLIQTLCTGESITVNGVVYDENNPTGTEVLVDQASNGCDSIVNIDLSFGSASVENIAQTLCPGESITVNNIVYDEANPMGSDTIPNGSSGGCDSIINVNLTFLTNPDFDLIQTLCTGESITVNGVVYDENNPTGTEVLVDQASNGCDSIVNIELSYVAPVVNNVNLLLCEGDSVIINGTVYNEQNSMGSDTLLNAANNGCDSIINIDIGILLRPELTIDQGICPGDSIIVNGTVYNQANPIGTEVLSGQAANGCDSIININLTPLNPGVNNFTPSVCEGASVTVNGTVYDENNPNGVEVIPGGAANGCDSMIMVNLNILNNSTFDLVSALCDGESIEVNGTIYDENNPSGTEVLENGAVNGCDSIVNVSLTFEPFISGAINGETAICLGDSAVLTFDLAGGTLFNVVYSDGVNQFPLNNIVDGETITVFPSSITEYSLVSVEVPGSSCPSQVNQDPVTVTVSDLQIEVEIISDFDGFAVSCNGSNDGTAGVNILEGIGPFEYDWSNNGQFEEVSNLSAGTYSVTVTDGVGCTDEGMVTLSEPPRIFFNLSSASPSCFGDNDGSITIDTIVGGAGGYRLSLGDLQGQQISFFPFTLAFLEAGSYDVNIEDTNGCSVSQGVNIFEPSEPVVDLGEDQTIQLGDSIQLSGKINFDFEFLNWEPFEEILCDDCLDPKVGPINTTIYTLTAADSSGCEATDRVTIFVEKSREVFIPNAFSPDGDGENDVFFIFANQQEVVQIISFQIYDRWGERVFEAGNFQPNDPLIGWDGTFRGKDMPPAVFVYYAEIEFVDGEVRMFKGDVTLVR